MFLPLPQERRNPFRPFDNQTHHGIESQISIPFESTNQRHLYNKGKWQPITQNLLVRSLKF